MLSTDSSGVSVVHFGQHLQRISIAGSQVRHGQRILARRGWILAFIASDFAACAASNLLAGLILSAAGRLPGSGLLSGHRWLAALFLSWGILIYLDRRGHYRHRHPFWTQARHVGFIGGFAASVCLFAQLLDAPVEAELLLGGCVLPCVLLSMRRGVRALLERYDLWCIRILVVGDKTAGERAQTAIDSEASLGYQVAAVIDMRRPGEPETTRPWRKLLLDYRAELLLLATDDIGCAVASGVVGSALKERVPLAIAPLLSGLPVHGWEQLSFFRHDVMLLIFRNNLAEPWAIPLKRAIDLIIAATAVVAVAPAFALLAMLVKCDGGPVFFAHRRIGAGGRIFRCLKFRTMVLDSEAVLARTLAGDPAASREWAQTRKLANDPRVTALGRILRRASIDELPQLLNILRGEMSLVGPRPIVEEEVVQYGRDIDYYYQTRPGLTGLWQVSGRSDITYDRRVQLDVWYVRNWTFWNDLAILCMTVSAVFLRKGAR